MKPYMKTILNAVMAWVKNNSISDWNQEDSSQLDYIKNKPEIATSEDAIDYLIENGHIEPMATSDGTIFTDGNDVIYTLS